MFFSSAFEEKGKVFHAFDGGDPDQIGAAAENDFLHRLCIEHFFIRLPV